MVKTKNLHSFTRIVQTFEEFATQLVQQEDFFNITVIAGETLLQAQRVSFPLLNIVYISYIMKTV